MSKTSGYRADIDGLRAIAILPVLLFHAGLAGFAGGFVGVDVFFVISGFLITGIIAAEIDQGRFSILSFYERRARRIMPLLIIVISAVLLAASWLYLPDDFAAVPRSAIAATLFLSNLSFFHETGYFAGGAETKPLLHTWSLAIEEQFYIGFPLLLMLVARCAPAWRRAVIGLVALASFAIAVATQHHADGFAFYLLPPRAWELFVGALLALTPPPARHSPAREAIAAAGIVAIAVAVFGFDKHTVFPGVSALLPVLGAAALIRYAPGTLAGRLLGLPAFTAIGLISYSVYMWHWPLIVFVQYATDTRLAGWSSGAVVLASLLIGWASWRWIETPFRQRRRIGRAAIFAGTGIGMALTCAASVALIATDGWPSRFAPTVIRLADGADDISPDRVRCHDSDATHGRPPCVLGAAVPPTALLWGDSHGVELAYVLAQGDAAHGRSLVQRTQSSCPPLIGYDPADDPRCAPANREVLAQIRADRALHTIYLAGYWATYRAARPNLPAALEATIASLVAEGRQVVLIGPIPSNTVNVPRHLAHLAAFGRLDQAEGSPRARIDPLDRDLRGLAARWASRGVHYISPVDRLCDRRRCAIIADGRPLYFDLHHLSVAGARKVLGQR